MGTEAAEGAGTSVCFKGWGRCFSLESSHSEAFRASVGTGMVLGVSLGLQGSGWGSQDYA